MKQINKIDYMVGAFLSYLTSRNIAPVLIEATDNAKIVKFSTNNNDYKVYFKYSISSKTPTVKGREYTKWNITYTPDDLKRIKESKQNEHEVFLLMVLCGNEDLTDTELLILDYEGLEKCIGTDTINCNKRLSVNRMKKSPYITCYGTGLSDQNSIKVYRNFEKYIKF